MHAAIGPVIHIARYDLTRFVSIGAFDHEDQLITDMLMARQLGTWCEAHKNRAALGFLVLPDRFLLNSGHGLGPGKFAQIEILGGWRITAITRRFDAPGD